MNVLVVDDQRIFAPREGVTMAHCTTSQEGLGLLYSRPWDEVWLDHDLGMESKMSGSEMIDYIEKRAVEFCDRPSVKRFFLHSANPVGRVYMYRVLKALGYEVLETDPYDLLDYDAMEQSKRNPFLAGPKNDVRQVGP